MTSPVEIMKGQHSAALRFSAATFLLTAKDAGDFAEVSREEMSSRGLGSNCLKSCILILFFAIVIAAQPSKLKGTDAVTLRTRFVAAFGQEFDLVKDKVTTRSNESGGGTYWLAFVRPKRSAYYYLQYRYRYNDQLYSHVEREIHFGVGPKGGRRGMPYAGTYSRFCLGDTVIIPVVVDAFTEHEFKLIKAEPIDAKDWDTVGPGTDTGDMDTTQVENPSAGNLRYLGYRTSIMLHRSPGYTIQLYAEFEALKPGKFNLLVGSAPGSAKPGETSLGSVPIIVMARDAPITMLAGHEEVRGFAVGFDGREYVSSTSGNSYMTSVLVLQPGDRISLLYLNAVRNEQFVSGQARPPAPEYRENIKPFISVHPFSIAPVSDFTEWLADYL
jgi:hypothetical protein